MPDEFPKMVYGPSGRTHTIHTADEMSKLGKGWSDKPAPEHFQTQTPTRQIVPTATTLSESDLDALATRIANVMAPMAADIIVGRLMDAQAPATEEGE